MKKALTITQLPLATKHLNHCSHQKNRKEGPLFWNVCRRSVTDFFPGTELEYIHNEYTFWQNDHRHSRR